MRPEDQKKWLLMGQNILSPNPTDLSFVFYDDDDDDDDDLYIIGAVCLSVCLSVCNEKAPLLFKRFGRFSRL